MRVVAPHIKWPRRIRSVFAAIWKGTAGPNIIIAGPRGGGKSALLGALGFCLFFLRGLKVVDMGGSEAQAKVVYNYFRDIVYADQRILRSLPKEPTIEHTDGNEANYFKCVAASHKAVRGPHPDVLFGDEACETDADVMYSALPMVNTSETPLRVITSTFHKLYGVFQDIWDGATDMGYTRFRWDVFDVTLDFSPEIWKNEKLRSEIPDFSIDQAGEMSLEYRCKGRTGDPEGWFHIENLINDWRAKSSIEWFDVEYMGTRPSAAGLVNDPEDVEACVYNDQKPNPYAYEYPAETRGGLDWGFSGMSAWEVFMRHKDDVKVRLESKDWSRVRSSIIIAEIVEDVRKYNIGIINADSSHHFENLDLQTAIDNAGLSCTVVEKVFGKEKEVMLGNYRTHYQERKLRTPKRFVQAIWQDKRYAYTPGSDKPKKENDHHPDATMCALSDWPLGITIGSIADVVITSEKDLRPITAGFNRKTF